MSDGVQAEAEAEAEAEAGACEGVQALLRRALGRMDAPDYPPYVEPEPPLPPPPADSDAECARAAAVYRRGQADLLREVSNSCSVPIPIPNPYPSTNPNPNCARRSRRSRRAALGRGARGAQPGPTCQGAARRNRVWSESELSTPRAFRHYLTLCTLYFVAVAGRRCTYTVCTYVVRPKVSTSANAAAHAQP